MRRETESRSPAKGGQAFLSAQLAIDAVEDGVEPQLFI
jgi:hypothetical protein